MMPTLILLGVLALAAWRGTVPLPRWFRFVPLAAGVVLFMMVGGYGAVPDWVGKYPNVVSAWAGDDGPTAFRWLLSPFYLGAVLLALGIDRTHS